MNLREELLKEKVQLKEQALKISLYCSASPKRFKELMQCFLADDNRLAQRAAWSVSIVAEKNPELVLPYIKTLVEQLLREDVHDAIIRNSLRILQKAAIPESLHGELMNACFVFIESNSIAVAIKAFALTVLFNLSKLYPEIKPELKLLIEERWPHETAAFKSRGKHILKAMGTA